MSDPDLARKLREVIAADDAARVDFEKWDYEFQKKMKQRSGATVVYKRFDPVERQQQRVADLSAEVQERWDSWLEARLDDFARDVGREIGIAQKEILAEIKRAIAEDVRLPVIEGWTPRFFQKGSIVLAGGGCYQAREDTSFPPGHSSWQCVAAPGERGEDGKDFSSVVDLPKWPRKHNAG